MGRALGLSRAAVWKQVRTLRRLGLTVKAERGRGYQLERSLNLLSAARIRSALAPTTREILDSLEVLTVTASTNQCLTRRQVPPPGRLWAVLAEYQTGGRGRRGRRWLSPLAHGICLSVSWAFEVAPRNLSSLSLVAGVAVCQGLADMGVQGVRLKWPNDIMGGGGKVGGILVEVAGESGGPLRTVIGIGINVRPVSGLAEAIRQEGGQAPAVGLDELRSEGGLERNLLAATLLNALHASLREFAHGRGERFLDAWRQFDYLAGRPVVVTSGENIFSGIAQGIADDGSLLVETGDRVVAVVAGDVTLRRPS